MTNHLRLWADFNELEDQEIWTTLRRVGFIPAGDPREGQWVELWDYDGDTCWAKVVRVEYPLVYLRIDPSTWRDGQSVDLPGPQPALAFWPATDSLRVASSQ